MFNLTQQERLVLFSFVAIVLIGTMLQYSFKKNPFLMNMVNVVDSEDFYQKVDLNKANYEELLIVPYIGPVTARGIIAYREKKGAFTLAKQLREVKGMHSENYKKIIKYLSINGQNLRNP